MNTALREIFAKQGRLAQALEGLNDDADLFAAGLDSLAIVNVMLAVEDRFEVEIPDEHLNRATFSSISALAAVLRKLQAEQHSA
ncbi:acyl carrier protein [Curvibacter sp. HBC28]|uniref:Acyl carrier protein n=1 Tax=Curvibacter microcysteis TaxID=3026419 RepID=A0ABT5ME72_9BURK|nr:acyl carrier protein [Curvibacter sp. HBC28]MDD0814886.1 acyl carrier protein [Curvibacter sp. HBC28]